MKRYLTYLIVSISALFLGSCRLSPEGSYVNPIQEPDASLISISLNDYDDQATIALYQPASFSYDIDKGTTQSPHVEILLGDNKIKTTSELSGSFTLNNYNLETGTFKLRIQLVAASGTGSLANALNLETITVWREWTLVIDVDYPPAPTLTHTISNGYSTLIWPKYTKPNFVKYEIVAEYGNLLTKHWTITDPNITSWTDSSYVGNYNVDYTITVTNLAGYRFKEISVYGYFDFTYSYNPVDSMVTVTLPPILYYHNFNYFTIEEDNVLKVTVTDPSKTTNQFKMSPGYYVQSELRVRYNHHSTGHPIIGASKQFVPQIITQKIPRRVSQYYFNSTLNQVIGFWSSGSTARLIRMDPLTLQPIDSLDIFNGPSYSVPYQGEYAYFSRPKDLVKINLVTHQETSFPAITTTFGSGPSVITGSSNELVSYAWFGPKPIGTGVEYYERVINTITGTQLIFLTGSVVPVNVISTNGASWRSTNGKIYQITGGSMTEIGTIPTPGWIGFRPDQSDEFMTHSSGLTRIYDANTLALKRTINSSAGYLGYDAPKKKLIYQFYPYLKVIDAETLSTSTFKVGGFIDLVINGNLLTSKGDLIRLY